jgi:hypothetical protein
MKIETREKPELVLECGLLFTGFSMVKHKLKSCTDAFSCSHELNFSRADVTNVNATNHACQTFDIEGNVTIPKSPFISRVLWANAGNIGSINVKPHDDKLTVEGVLKTNLVYECENNIKHSHDAEVPFSVNVKLDGVTDAHNVGCVVTPLTCNIKARRGKELLVDARVGVTVCGNKSERGEIIGEVAMGNQKPTDNTGIAIHVVQPNETLWDIAKYISVPTREIVRQNPETEQGVNAGERITLYRQKVVNM